MKFEKCEPKHQVKIVWMKKWTKAIRSKAADKKSIEMKSSMNNKHFGQVKTQLQQIMQWKKIITSVRWILDKSYSIQFINA